jgi:hypothetical protein
MHDNSVLPLRQPPKTRSKSVSLNVLFAAVILVACLQVAFLSIYSIRAEPNASFNNQLNTYPQGTTPHQQKIHPTGKKTRSSGPNSNITLVGASYSDDTMSDAAIKYLLVAACEFNIESHILLSKRIEKTSLDKRIYIYAQHFYMPLAKALAVRQPDCTDLIHIDQSPNQMELLHMTMTRMQTTGEITQLVSDSAPNNPLDPENRIAKIKRVREYQRQMIRDRKIHDLSQSVIVMLDLDMFDYPPLSKVMDVAENYILSTPSKEIGVRTTFDAICSNGLQRSRWWQTYPRRNYYDIFATILLPNTWPVLEEKRTLPHGLLKGENVTMAKLSQQELLDWFLSEGSKHNKDIYEPVPVRSCFGGLALYQADAWLHPTCRYDLYNKSLDVYRGKLEHQTCLRQNYSDFRIAVQPDLLTLWHLM